MVVKSNDIGARINPAKRRLAEIICLGCFAECFALDWNLPTVEAIQGSPLVYHIVPPLLGVVSKRKLSINRLRCIHCGFDEFEVTEKSKGKN